MNLYNYSAANSEEFALYYMELTAVVRRYIERTTGVRAPEQTTEEFLHEVGELAKAQTAISTAKHQYSQALSLFEEMGAIPDAAKTRTAIANLSAEETWMDQ